MAAAKRVKPTPAPVAAKPQATPAPVAAKPEPTPAAPGGHAPGDACGREKRGGSRGKKEAPKATKLAPGEKVKISTALKEDLDKLWGNGVR